MLFFRWSGFGFIQCLPNGELEAAAPKQMVKECSVQFLSLYANMVRVCEKQTRIAVFGPYPKRNLSGDMEANEPWKDGDAIGFRVDARRRKCFVYHNGVLLDAPWSRLPDHILPLVNGYLSLQVTIREAHFT